MAVRSRIWTRVLSKEDKARIDAACRAFIAEVLKPRFLPEIRPSTEFNYPIDLAGKWHGERYRFVQRYRSPFPEAADSPEFDAPFARLDHVGGERFDVMWPRHTGAWFRLHAAVTLAEALRLIETDGHLHPL